MANTDIYWYIRGRYFAIARTLIDQGNDFVRLGDILTCSKEIRHQYRMVGDGSLIQEAITKRAPLEFVQYLIGCYQTKIPSWRGHARYVRVAILDSMKIYFPTRNGPMDQYIVKSPGVNDPAEYLSILLPNCMNIDIAEDRAVFQQLILDLVKYRSSMQHFYRVLYRADWIDKFVNFMTLLVKQGSVDPFKRYAFDISRSTMLGVMEDTGETSFTVFGFIFLTLLDKDTTLDDELYELMLLFMREGWHVGPYKSMDLRLDCREYMANYLSVKRKIRCLRQKLHCVDNMCILLSPRFVPRIAGKVDSYYKQIPEDIHRRVWEALLPYGPPVTMLPGEDLDEVEDP